MCQPDGPPPLKAFNTALRVKGSKLRRCRSLERARGLMGHCRTPPEACRGRGTRQRPAPALLVGSLRPRASCSREPACIPWRQSCRWRQPASGSCTRRRSRLQGMAHSWRGTRRRLGGCTNGHSHQMCPVRCSCSRTAVLLGSSSPSRHRNDRHPGGSREEACRPGS